jgi:hypothetical protein
VVSCPVRASSPAELDKRKCPLTATSRASALLRNKRLRAITLLESSWL